MAKYVDLPISRRLLSQAGQRGLPAVVAQLRASYYLARLSTGDRLPPVRELAKQLKVSPTTALELYRELEVEGFVVGRERSGVFLRTAGREKDRARREAALFKAVSTTASKLSLQGLRPAEFATCLLRYTGFRPREDFRIGFLGYSESLEAIRTHLDERLRFKLPIVSIPLNGWPGDARRLLARDPSIRCLFCSFLFSTRAAALAHEFDLPLILLRQAPLTALGLDPPAAGRRHIIVRDRDCAGGLRRLVCSLAKQRDVGSVCTAVLEEGACDRCGRLDQIGAVGIRIAALDEEDRLAEFERDSDTFFAPPTSFDRVKLRYGRSKRVVRLAVELSDETVEGLLFHYLFSGTERRAKGRAAADSSAELLSSRVASETNLSTPPDRWRV